MPYSNTDIIARTDMKINALRHLPQIRQSEGGCQGRFAVLANGLNHCFSSAVALSCGSGIGISKVGFL